MSDVRRYNLADLVYLMRRLRDPETGCPWDLKQNFKTIVPHTLEEVYEVIDCIEREDYPHLKEELGDLLFQVIFYSQLGQEQSLFCLDDIISTLVSKLVTRHPHVFPEGTLESIRDPNQRHSDADIKQTWERIKKQERSSKGRQSVLADIPENLPALVRAAKLQKRASSHGFDWPSAEGVIHKLEEELAELKEAVEQGDQLHIEEELGDLLFSVVNLGRHLDVESETALRRTMRKFEHRFGYIEERAESCGKTIDELPLTEMDRLWDEIKLADKGGN